VEGAAGAGSGQTQAYSCESLRARQWLFGPPGPRLALSIRERRRKAVEVDLKEATMKRVMILTLGAMLAWAATGRAQDDPPPANPKAPAQSQVGPNFVDNDGDGICDRYQGRSQARSGRSARRGHGPGDGTGNRGVGPRDGSGYGPGAGTGNCDGTGPKGQGRRGGRR
jgi:hypothetical protein